MKSTGASDRSNSPRGIEAWRAFRHEWRNTDDYQRLARLGRRVDHLASDPEIARLLPGVRVAVLGSATVEFLLPVLKGALFQEGLCPTFHVAPYGQVTTSLIDPDSPVAQFAPQVTVVVNTVHHISRWPSLGSTLAEVQDLVDAECRSILEPCALFHQRTGSEILLNNFHSLPGRVAGNLGAKLPGDRVNFIRRLNLALGDRAPDGVHINDVAALVETRGVSEWFDERFWYLAKQPIAFDSVAEYCRSAAVIVGAVLGRSRKCLVLDLDNTLWGGVVGDDGLSGIHIGEGTAAGEAFKAFQMYLRELKDRGVLLAVCSKNEEAIATTAFVEHPDMVLRLEDFVAFKANWNRKSDNIRSIASELNLPLDALVFVDDNPAERHEVAQAIPELAVVDLPDDPAQFVKALDGARLFETTALTAEDMARTEAYRLRQRTLAPFDGAVSVQSHLASLEMHATIQPFEAASFERITQLVNKTNQFNLTTRRVVLADIQRMAADRSCFTRTVRLRDRFGDHGLISVLFGRVVDDRLLIDAWLMSCRVFGRGVEQLLFNALLAAAPGCGVREIVGFYRPTARNGLVKDHYGRLGFRRVDEVADTVTWRLEIAQAVPAETCIACDDLQLV